MLEDRTLVVADIHLGRASSFHVQGLPLPLHDITSDLERLHQLCQVHQAKRLLINGDLFHHPAGLSADLERLVENWITRLEIPVDLILGNHEEKLPRLPPSLRAVPSLERAGFLVLHDPLQTPQGRPTLAAHWHPVAKIKDGKRTTLRVPCFLLRGKMLVLPAFGTFTGGAVIAPLPEDRLFIGWENNVMEVPAALLPQPEA